VRRGPVVHPANLILGSGRWLGESVQDHPDFAWYPLIARSDNSELDYQAVQQIIHASSTSDDNGMSGSAELPDPALGGSVDVSLKFDRSDRVFEDGDLIGLTVAASRSGFLYVIFTDAEGKRTLAFPNAFDRDNVV
jgi:hypothetical protein